MKMHLLKSATHQKTPTQNRKGREDNTGRDKANIQDKHTDRYNIGIINHICLHKEGT